MNRKSSNQGIANRLHHAVCVSALLIMLAALPAYGQQQVTNCSTTIVTDGPESQRIAIDLERPGSRIPDDAKRPAARLLSGDQRHVHQHFYNGVSWSDDDLTALSGGSAASGQVSGFSVATTSMFTMFP